MLSYQGDESLKEMFILRFANHRKMDEVIQGTGFDGTRGCFIGCTMNTYDHEEFANQIGPAWLAHLAEKIFEGLPKEDAPQFGTDLLAAIPVGVDLEPVRHMLAIRRLDRLITLQKDCKILEVVMSLKLVRDCHEAELQGNSCDWAAARSAAEAAWPVEPAPRSAAWAAESAAESAARSAESAARSAESAARSAAWAARSAAWAARSAAYQQERDDLLAILREMKPVGGA